MSARVLVVYKRSTYQRYHGAQSDRIAELVEREDPSVRGMMHAHEAHLEALDETRAALRALSAKSVFRHRHAKDIGTDYDLVVTVGGDGTLLWASHTVGPNTPIVGINSAPENSVGYFCAGTRGEVLPVLRHALSKELRVTKFARMRVELDGEVISNRVLNDMLFCHRCPAAATRYLITHGDVCEEHISSGVWVGPAAGSTAAQRSAGGRVLALGSQKLQYVVREPFLANGERLRLEKGLVAVGSHLRIHSKIREGQIFIDGAQRTWPIDIGCELRLERSNEPLALLGLRARAPAEPRTKPR